MMTLLLNLLAAALSLLMVDIIFPSVSIHSFAVALITGLVIGLINAVIRPVLTILSLPVTILTLGGFLFVVNGVCFWLAAALVPGFSVHGVATFIFAPIMMAIASTALNHYFQEKEFHLPFNLEQKLQSGSQNKIALPSE